ncbi:SLATT domain-containing protein [Sinorhizobium meliloti]|uniref:SLATT domain-containing protein n=1 Tax=Rhizobium meliloti TaxID=382 RepID=UPI00299ECE38|nr:SLATT domain-containing protein [Sinorhizobium meliloti]MDW9924056.1 SLATT domain-containing protein [Sinorhizobium meliloti]MDX0035114.1 SLATT domain-containing protein [Sinorhizobium meliloti]
MNSFVQPDTQGISIQQVGPSLDEARENLLKEMKRTKGARFNASKRLEERAAKRTANTAYASAAVVVLTLLPVFFPVPSIVASAINLTTIGFSIFILASSLLQSAHADPVKADQFQRCALEINSLRRELRSLEAVDVAELRAHSARFDDILRRYNINHDDVDYEKYRLEHPDEFPQIAPQETETAREDVQHTHELVERLPYIIGALTAGLFVAATSSSFIEAALKASSDISQLYEKLFGASPPL